MSRVWLWVLLTWLVVVCLALLASLFSSPELDPPPPTNFTFHFDTALQSIHVVEPPTAAPTPALLTFPQHYDSKCENLVGFGFYNKIRPSEFRPDSELLFPLNCDVPFPMVPAYCLSWRPRHSPQGSHPHSSCKLQNVTINPARIQLRSALVHRADWQVSPNSYLDYQPGALSVELEGGPCENAVIQDAKKWLLSLSKDHHRDVMSSLAAKGRPTPAPTQAPTESCLYLSRMGEKEKKELRKKLKMEEVNVTGSPTAPLDDVEKELLNRLQEHREQKKRKTQELNELQQRQQEQQQEQERQQQQEERRQRNERHRSNNNNQVQDMELQEKKQLQERIRRQKQPPQIPPLARANLDRMINKDLAAIKQESNAEEKEEEETTSNKGKEPAAPKKRKKEAKQPVQEQQGPHKAIASTRRALPVPGDQPAKNPHNRKLLSEPENPSIPTRHKCLLAVSREHGEHNNVYHMTTDLLAVVDTLLLHNIPPGRLFGDPLHGDAQPDDSKGVVGPTPGANNAHHYDECNIVLMDQHAPSKLDILWKILYGHDRVFTYQQLFGNSPSPVFVDNFILVPPGYDSRLYIDLEDSQRICPERVESWAWIGTWVRSRVLELARTSKEKSLYPPLTANNTVVIIARRGEVSRQWFDETGIINAVRSTLNAFSRATAGGAWQVKLVDLREMDTRSQIHLIAHTRILIGVHGAALTYSLFLPSDAALLEVGVDAKLWYSFKHIAQWRGLIYHELRLSDGDSPDGGMRYRVSSDRLRKALLTVLTQM